MAPTPIQAPVLFTKNEIEGLRKAYHVDRYHVNMVHGGVGKCPKARSVHTTHDGKVKEQCIIE